MEWWHWLIVYLIATWVYLPFSLRGEVDTDDPENIGKWFAVWVGLSWFLAPLHLVVMLFTIAVTKRK